MSEHRTFGIYHKTSIKRPPPHLLETWHLFEHRPRSHSKWQIQNLPRGGVQTYNGDPNGAEGQLGIRGLSWKLFVHFHAQEGPKVKDLNDKLAPVPEADCFSQSWPVPTFGQWGQRTGLGSRLMVRYSSSGWCIINCNPLFKIQHLLEVLGYTLSSCFALTVSLRIEKPFHSIIANSYWYTLVIIQYWQSNAWIGNDRCKYELIHEPSEVIQSIDWEFKFFTKITNSYEF